MKHLRQTVLFILLGFLLTACHHTADRLLSIEQLIKLNPTASPDTEFGEVKKERCPVSA